MPTGSRNDPLASYHFFVDIEGVFQGTFRECSGLGVSQDVIEYWHAGKDGDTQWAKIPGRAHFDDLNFKGGITQDSKKLWDWHKKFVTGAGDGDRLNGTIWMFDQTNTPKASWRFSNGWPSKLKGPSMNAGNNEIGMEELTISHELLERTM
jgi:phage tail-like protein